MFLLELPPKPLRNGKANCCRQVGRYKGNPPNILVLQTIILPSATVTLALSLFLVNIFTMATQMPSQHLKMLCRTEWYSSAPLLRLTLMGAGSGKCYTRRSLNETIHFQCIILRCVCRWACIYGNHWTVALKPKYKKQKIQVKTNFKLPSRMGKGNSTSQPACHPSIYPTDYMCVCVDVCDLSVLKIIPFA